MGVFMQRWMIAGVLICLLVIVGCGAKKDLRLEMTRETVIHDPVISALTISPSGKLDTRESGHRVTLRMSGDPGLQATFDVEGAFDGRAMTEVEPGVYQGTYEVRKGSTGNPSFLGHLLHTPSGASQHYRLADALTFRPSAPPPPKVCTPEMARAFDQQLRNLTTFFAFDDSEISEESQAALTAGKAVLQMSPLCTIFVLGHADAVGEDEYNDRLSTQRAEGVVAFLKTLGIANARISQRAYGESQPASDKERDRNRRVELRAFNPYGS